MAIIPLNTSNQDNPDQNQTLKLDQNQTLGSDVDYLQFAQQYGDSVLDDGVQQIIHDVVQQIIKEPSQSLTDSELALTLADQSEPDEATTEAVPSKLAFSSHEHIFPFYSLTLE